MKPLIIIMFTILIVLLIVTAAQAGTEPGEFTCDLVSSYDRNDITYRSFYCNEDTMSRSDTCELWRTTLTQADSTDGETITYWYMCNEFRSYIPITMNWGTLDSTPKSLSGRLINPNETPINNTVMRLGSIITCTTDDLCYYYVDGANSPAATTDTSGIFEFADLTPARYVILVHDLYTYEWWILADDQDDNEIWSVYEYLNVGNIIFDVTEKKISDQVILTTNGG